VVVDTALRICQTKKKEKEKKFIELNTKNDEFYIGKIRMK
jgi:hypothetical protein